MQTQVQTKLKVHTKVKNVNKNTNESENEIIKVFQMTTSAKIYKSLYPYYSLGQCGQLRNNFINNV